MAQIDKTMFESGTAKTKNLPLNTKSERPKRECRTRKRPYDLEQYSTKRLKDDQLDFDEQDENSCTFTLTNSDSDEDIETESSDEIEQLTIKQFDDNSDIEDIIEDDTTNVCFSKVSSDQHRHIPVVINQTASQQQQNLTRHSKRLISQFKYYYDHGLRKSIQTTDSSDLSTTIGDDKYRGELKNTFNRLDLFKEGYCVLSNEPFPFHSLCYLCGSLGTDLIYCNSCCEGYHLNCLNEYEQPRQNSSSQFWLCPNCNVCTVCGLLNSTNDFLISCFDCQKTYHFKCLKRSFDEQYYDLFQTNQSILSLSRLSNSYLINQIWFCPTCIHCDCGEKLYSNERNLLCLTKTFLSQQSQMCIDCLNQLKMLRLEKNDSIEKCLFCEKFIEQILSKTKSICSLLQCSKCQARFHWICDGYLSEDLSILPQIKHLISNIICSKCDRNQRDNIRKELNNYKIQILENIQTNLLTIFPLIFQDENQFEKFQIDLNNLQHLHQTYFQSLNLQLFLNDLLCLIRKVLHPSDIQRWQGVIDGSIRRQCPWFQSIVYLTNKKSFHTFQSIPTNDHNYVNQNEYHLRNISTNSFLIYLDNCSNHFTNFHQNDTRKCQLCEMNSDHQLSLIGRLISFGLNQWVHVGCILAAYAKNLDQPPYILRNIRETIVRCQNKYICVLCSKLGASVHCYETECYQRFHCQCIIKYYSSINQTILQQLNLKHGFLPNLTTLCLKHNSLKTMNQISDSSNDDEIRNHSKIKYVNPLSTVYGDLSNNFLDLNLNQTYLCIGSLQIECLGNFDYQINKIYENFIYNQTYPNNYRASRLFWSMKNPQKKIRYYLHIEISQSYHENPLNHQIKEYPLKNEQIVVEDLYEICRKYFQKFQKQIDDHLNTIDEFCQKTIINKKNLINQTNSRKKANTIGTGTTKRIPKVTPSCVKRQTPKAALKNVSRPRNRFANEKTNAPKSSNEIENIFSKTNVSQFALALVQALRHVGQSTKIQQESNTNFHPTNGLTNEKTTNDILLKQLLKNITVPQQINASHQYRSTISTQTDISEDLKLNGLSSHSYSSPTTDNTTNLFLKPTYIPQVDGSIDQDDDNIDDYHHIIPSILNSLIEQITSERIRSKSEHSMDLSDYVNSPSLIPFIPISPNDQKQSNSSSSSSDILIQLYQQWLKRNFFSVKFTIRNDDGYEIVSDDLESAWFEILQLIHQTRTDMKFERLSMTNQQFNGHQIFGLTKPIIISILNQLYSNEQSVGTISLPLSSSSSSPPPSSSSTLTVNSDENLLRKNSILSGSRAHIYERKTRERQRFGWLLNQSRKIEYAVKSFEYDTALYHARRILLEEASVSLRLYHLHYFSERALLVGSSPIHGCGLFTLVDLVEGQMIIEYTGEVVRPCLTDKRERENEGKGFGCYMFTVDSMNVIDATHRGNKARFINHNCQPNCFAKTVLSGGVKHIVIYALKDIPRGSELTYDYSFPEEDIKIPCHCGTTQCRVYLN